MLKPRRKIIIGQLCALQTCCFSYSVIFSPVIVQMTKPSPGRGEVGICGISDRIVIGTCACLLSFGSPVAPSWTLKKGLLPPAWLSD